MVLTPSQVETHTPAAAQTQIGSWNVMRDELLSRPYLRFGLPTQDARALVIRPRRSADGLYSHLICISRQEWSCSFAGASGGFVGKFYSVLFSAL